jgi:hypothetical protein
MTERELVLLLTAAQLADWNQVVLTGGPPCFFFESDRNRFCLRAQRWRGHEVGGDHLHTSLAELLLRVHGKEEVPDA